MPQTPYTETEALLLAIADSEADSAVFDVDEYLRENFTIGELRRLQDAASLLADRARAIRHGKLG